MEVGPNPNNDEEMSSAGEEAFQFQELSSVIFLINDLSFDNPGDDIDASGAEPDLVDDIGDLAATYMLPQLLILSSQLNSAGGLRSVYVNFGPKGYYWLNPESWPVNDRREFENLLGGLFEKGMIIDPVTDEVLCHKITDLRDNVPANSKLIGCLDGADSIGVTSIKDYLENASLDEQTYIFVVGKIANQDIELEIDDYVKVYESKLDADLCLLRVIDAVEDKLFG